MTDELSRWRGSCWLIRWDSPFGVTYMAKRRGGFKIVDHPGEAFRFETKESAEAAAVLIVAKDITTLLGKTSVREWDGGKRYP